MKFLLQLANEYQIAKLVQRCEEYLLTKDMTVESLAMAQHYGLERLESAALSSLKHKTIQEMETCEGYSVLSSGTVAQLYRVRGEHLEQTLKNIYHVWKGLGKCSDHTLFNFPPECVQCAQLAKTAVQGLCVEAMGSLSLA